MTRQLALGIGSVDGGVLIILWGFLGIEGHDWKTAPRNRFFLRPATGELWARPQILLGGNLFVVPYWFLLCITLGGAGVAWLLGPPKQETAQSAE